MTVLSDRIKDKVKEQAEEKARAAQEERVAKQETITEYAPVKQEFQSLADLLNSEQQFKKVFGKATVDSDRWGYPRFYSGNCYLGDSLLDDMEGGDYFQIVVGLTKEDKTVYLMSLVPDDSPLDSFIEDDELFTNEVQEIGDIKEKALDTIASHLAEKLSSISRYILKKI